MKVQKTVDLGNGHLIEIGKATWADGTGAVSIRNRYPTKTGGFSPRSSSEIPIADVMHLTLAAAEDDRLTPSELTAMISALSAALARKTNSGRSPSA